jgi:ABC-type multidrug transport system ATPase subunit
VAWDDARGAAVTVEGLGLDGRRGPVFRDVSLRAPAGSLVAVRGPGRTCLLLVLTGRLKPSAGHAEVAGHRLPRRAAAVRRVSALGPVPGVTDLEPSLTVAEHLRERALLSHRCAAARGRAREALGAAGLDPGALPEGLHTPVRDLERPAAFRLGVALAVTTAPRLLAVDDVGLTLSPDEHAAAWRLLRSLADAGTTVLAVGDPPGDVETRTLSTASAARTEEDA